MFTLRYAYRQQGKFDASVGLPKRLQAIAISSVTDWPNCCQNGHGKSQ